MTATLETTTTDQDIQERDALVERLFGSLIGGMEVVSVELGVRLGLYDALVSGPATSDELAERSGIHERYAREWLEQQATAAIVAADNPSAPAEQRRYALPPGHAEALTDPESPGWAGAIGLAMVGVSLPIDAVAEAYRSGGGVPYADYGREVREAIASFNRPGFRHDLASWFASVDAVDERLRRPGARVLDLGCGVGWSTLAIARAYPDAIVHGVDLDEASIAEARRHADEAGVGDRVRFEVRDATATDGENGGYDLVTVFEALHDMADPVGVLDGVRRILVDGGSVVVADEKVADSFTAPGDEFERFNYGWSVLHCLPATRAEDARVDAGTVLRSETAVGYGHKAGYGTVDVLSIEHDFWRFYRLVP